MLCKIVLLFVVLIAFPLTALTQDVIHFKNGMWWNGTIFEKVDFYSVGGILRKKYPGNPSRVMDLDGMFVIPPFADAHNHGLASVERLDEEIQSFLSQGIFYVMNPNNIPAFTEPVRKRMNGPGSPDVIWSNGGLTSSGGHPIQIYANIAAHDRAKWTGEIVNQAYYVIDSVEDLRQKWPAIVADQPDFIKVYLEYSEEHARRRSDPSFYGKRGIDPQILPELINHAHRSNLRVAAHVNTAADFRNAVRAGVDIVAHLPLERITAEDARLAADHRVTVITTTVSHRPTEHIENPSSVYRDNIVTLLQNGATIALGTDSHRSVIDEAQNIIALGAMDPATLLNIATEKTAQVIFPNRKVGRLAEGYEASFIALSANPLQDFSAIRKISVFVKDGQILRLKIPIATALTEELRGRGVDSAVRLYRSLRSTKPEEYDFAETQLNKLGYELLRHGNIPAATMILELNAEMYPDSSNVYDSLGEAYMLGGDPEKARTNYLKSLQLNPKNTNASEMLKKLGTHSKP